VDSNPESEASTYEDVIFEQDEYDKDPALQQTLKENPEMRERPLEECVRAGMNHRVCVNFENFVGNNLNRQILFSKDKYLNSIPIASHQVDSNKFTKIPLPTTPQPAPQITRK
jgi:hypothetical protein